MGHITSKNYLKLQERIDDAVQGGVNSELLHKILDLLFTEDEAKLVTVLPLNMFTVHDVQKRWGKTEKETKKILDRLADKGILFDFKYEKSHAYFLAPTMAGIFEFTLMRTDNHTDHKIFSELLTEYTHKNKNYITDVFASNPGVARVYPNEEIFKENKSVILDFERASKIIKDASAITLGRCFCRHKMEHLGKTCKYPQDTCMTLNKAADDVIRHKLAKKISKKKALEVLQKSRDLGLVQIGDNIQEQVNWICNCCSCCCEAISAYKQLGHKIHIKSNFFSENNSQLCKGCGVCVKKCPVGAITMKNNVAIIDKDKCFGCGICAYFCPSKSLSLKRIENPEITPKDNFERIVMTALDKGKIQNYIVENNGLITHRILNRLLGFILSLKPAKRILAQRQLRSRFINSVLKAKKFKLVDKVYNKNDHDYSHKEIELMKKNKLK